MKIFVGTMFSGEGDFDDCCNAIKSQQDVEVEHFIIKNQPEKEAHNLLWNAWRERQKDFDIFVKVDADTVLKNDGILKCISLIMENNKRITGIQAPLHDYFTDGFINGLNCFSNKVTFKDSSDDLYCDRHVDVNHDIVISSTNVPYELCPAGLHCHKPTDIQAFHFGVHRALKNQTEIIARVKQAYSKHKDRYRALAILGAQYSNQFSKNRKFNYNDKDLIDVFQRALSSYDSSVMSQQQVKL